MKQFGLGTEGHILDETISNTTVRTSRIIPMQEIGKCSFHLITTGTLAGSWSIQASNNWASSTAPALGQPPNAGNWPPITDITIPNAVSGGQDIIVCVTDVNHASTPRVLRIQFTPTSGSGDCDVWFFGKGV